MTIVHDLPRRRTPVPERTGLANSPAQVQTSLAGAVTLGMEKGRFAGGVELRGLNLLLTYDAGCRARCTYCGLAKDRPEVSDRARNHTFIRVKWPTYDTDTILERVREDPGPMQRVCVAMLQDHRAFEDSNAVMRRFRDGTSMGISALITATVIRSRAMVEEILEAGADMFTVAFDACTPELFERTRGRAARGPHRWEHHWQVLRWGVEVFGRFKAGVHLVCGLGETEEEMVRMIQRVHDTGGHTHLFAFFPEAGTVMQDVDPAPMGHYRRIQLARYLIDNEIQRVERMRFNARGQIVDHGCDVRPVLRYGEVFMTSGCAGHDGRNACNRPFGNERPSMPQRNHPMPLDDALKAAALVELRDGLGEAAP
jgi:lipoyl synthase